ncbi:MAG TPA: Dyp-type peroxidase, partial [Actinotalea sp.]|nr:Dyp-type peroxidase [Actinotalea sp.]
AAAGGAGAPGPAPDTVGTATVPFRGVHQAGVATPAQAFARFLSFDLVPGVDRAGLARLMRIWTEDAERLTGGRPGLTDTEPWLAATPARLTITLGVGRGFLAAAGRGERVPPWLEPLPPFPVDRLQERWSGGDLLLQVAADDVMTVTHACRVLTSAAARFVGPRWTQTGFRPAAGTLPPGATIRNLMGQVDGSANPDPQVEPHLIWHDDRAEPWLAGATTMVVRRIAMDLDAWGRVDRAGREFAIGRTLDTGAPLTGGTERDTPGLAAVDAAGLPVIDTAAHVRRARTDDHRERFLRRPFNFHDPSGPVAERSGLVFVTFQRDIGAQFLPVQRRLAALDRLNQWTTPIGSAVFLVPRGVEAGEDLAERLLG